MAAIGSAERRIITNAFASLLYQDQSHLENGLAFNVLVKAASDFTNDFTIKQLEDIIHKEISVGSFVRLSNGNLALGPADNDGDSCDSSKFEYSNKVYILFICFKKIVCSDVIVIWVNLVSITGK